MYRGGNLCDKPLCGMAWRRGLLPPDMPSYLVAPAMAVTEDALFLHGGISSEGRLLDDLWQHDLSTGRWHHVPTVGPTPHAGFGHSLVVLRNEIILMGARSSDQHALKDGIAALVPPDAIDAPLAAELWTLNLLNGTVHAAAGHTASLRWERRPTPAAVTRVEHCAQANNAAARMVIAHGSGLGAGLVDDVWQWDLLASWEGGATADSPWSRLNGGERGGLRPAARRSPACALLSSKLLLTGGTGTDGEPLTSDGLWSLDLASHVWRHVPAAEASDGTGAGGHPSPIRSPPLAACADRAVRLACEPRSGGTTGEVEAGGDGARGSASLSTVWVYSGRHEAWQRLALRPTSASEARLAAPACPPGLRWARSAAPSVCSASSRLWLMGTPEGASQAELWQFGAGVACSTGCVHGQVAAVSGVCVCEQGWGGPDCSHPVCGVPCGAHGVCNVLSRSCECHPPWHGLRCEQRPCVPSCAPPHGQCDATSGECLCSPPWYGVGCARATCPRCMHGSRCDEASGCCACALGFEGCDCSRPSAGVWFGQHLAARADDRGTGHALAPPPQGARLTWRYGAACAPCGSLPALFGGLGDAMGPTGGGGAAGRGHLPDSRYAWGGGEGDASAARALPPRPAVLSAEVWVATEAASPQSRARWQLMTVADDDVVHSPSGRKGAAMVGMDASLVAVHGGLSEEGAANGELWWLRCTPIAPGAPPASWRLLRYQGEAPLARAYHTLVRTPASADGSLNALLYGGSRPTGNAAGSAGHGPTGHFFTDVWRLSVPSAAAAGGQFATAGRAQVAGGGQWEQLVPPTGDGTDWPPARAAHAAATHTHGACCRVSGCMVVFGGLDSTHGALGDMWEFCVANRTWSRIPHIGAVAWPSARQQHTLTAVSLPPPSDQAAPRNGSLAREMSRPSSGALRTALHTPAAVLLLYGGVTRPTAIPGPSVRVEDSLWAFSLSLRTWTRLHTPLGNARPSGRFGHVALSVRPGTLWLYGGLSDTPEDASAHDVAADGGLRDAHWHFTLPPDSDATLAICAGCSGHGACDLQIRRCVCEPPWGGEDCAAPQAASVPSIPRQAFALLLWLSSSLLVGSAIGWLHRHRALAREAAERARDGQRERARAHPHVMSSAAAAPAAHPHVQERGGKLHSR